MKKMFALFLTLCFLFTCALADASLTPVQTMVQLLPYFDSYVVAYCAEVVNTGDVPIGLDSDLCRIELMDAEGNVLLTDTIYSTSPSVLAPGETGYVIPFHLYLEDIDVNALTDYALHLYAEEDRYSSPVSYISADSYSTQLITQQNSWGEEETFVDISFTNKTEETIFDFYAVMAIYDQNDQLIFTSEESVYELGVPAGQTVIMRAEIDEEFTSYWKDNGIEPSRIHIIGYQN